MFLSSTLKKVFLILVLLVELFLYTLFLYFDFNDINIEISNWLKYVGIIICFLASLIPIFSKNSAKPQYFIPFSLFFTLISDYFLLINTDKNLYIFGVVIFIIVQLSYFIYIETLKKNKTSFLISLIFRIILSSILIIVLSIIRFDLLSIVSACYFVELLMNFITSLSLIKINKFFLIFSIGLLLFIGCDISVGLTNLDLFEGHIKNLVSNLMWIFYLPSQVLISFSNYINFKNIVYRV